MPKPCHGISSSTKSSDDSNKSRQSKGPRSQALSALSLPSLASSSHSARSIRPVRRQIREPTHFNGFSIRHPHHPRLNPTAVDRFEHGLARRALLRTPPLHRGAAANEHRHGASRHPCRQSPCVQTMPRFLFEDQPLRAPFHKRLRHSRLDPRNRLIDHLLGARARHTGVLGGAIRHRERIRARLDHPFDSTSVGFAFSTRPLQQSLKIAERRKIGLTRLLDRLQKRPHELAFQRIDMHTPVERRPLDPRDLLRKTEVTTPYGRRSLVGRRPQRAPGLSIPPIALTRPSRSPGPAFPATTRSEFR